jgi:hypothetical protein
MRIVSHFSQRWSPRTLGVPVLLDELLVESNEETLADRPRWVGFARLQASKLTLSTCLSVCCVLLPGSFIVEIFLLVLDLWERGVKKLTSHVIDAKGSKVRVLVISHVNQNWATTGGHSKSKIKYTNLIVKMDRLPDPPDKRTKISTLPPPGSCGKMTETRTCVWFWRENWLRCVSFRKFSISVTFYFQRN